MPRFPTRVTTVDLYQPHVCIIGAGLSQMRFHPRSPLQASREAIARLKNETEELRQGVAEIDGVLAAILDQSQFRIIKEFARSWDDVLPTILEYMSLRLAAQLSVFTISAPDRRMVFWRNIISPLIRMYEIPTDPDVDLSYHQALQRLTTPPADS
jgi:hypothetical protein